MVCRPYVDVDLPTNLVSICQQDMALCRRTWKMQSQSELKPILT